MKKTSPYDIGKVGTEITADLPDGSARCGIVHKVVHVAGGADIEYQCTAAAVMVMTYGCIHEHIVDVNTCGPCREEVITCLADPGVLCVLCEEAGCTPPCLVEFLSEVPIPSRDQLVQ